MNKQAIGTAVVLSAIILLTGCTSAGTQQTGTGVTVLNELSTDRMQPGGTVLLRTSINNYFDNELVNAKAKLVRDLGSSLTTDNPTSVVGTIQANPNATVRAQWTLKVGTSAPNGLPLTNRVRLCFTYNQTSWHELALVNSFDINSTINTGGDTGPLAISFAGLDMPYVYNQDVQSTIPISVSIANNFAGSIGNIDTPAGQTPNLTYVEMRIYDSAGSKTVCGNMDDASTTKYADYNLADDASDAQKVSFLESKHNCQPVINNHVVSNNLLVQDEFTNPACSGNNIGCLVCNNGTWTPEINNIAKGYYRCYAQNLSVFSNGQTFIGTKLNMTKLNTEELIEKVEVLASYDYCVESSDFTINVFTPGGK